MTDYPAATQQRCRAIVYYDGSLVFEENHPTRRERFDAILEHLKDNYSEISDEQIEDLLADYRPNLTADDDDEELYDDALDKIVSELYAVYLGDITIHLDEPKTPVAAPSVLYSMLTNYGDSAEPIVMDGTESEMIIEHFPTAALRLKSLRERASSFAELFGYKTNYSQADETQCLEIINWALTATEGKVSLLQSAHIENSIYAPVY